MPKVPRPSKVRGKDLDGISQVPALRHRALREITQNYAHVFSDPGLHKNIVAFLFSQYVTSAHPEALIAQEFWKVYRHLMEGRSILEFEFLLIDRTSTVNQLRKILRGELVSLDTEDDNE